LSIYSSKTTSIQTVAEMNDPDKVREWFERISPEERRAQIDAERMVALMEDREHKRMMESVLRKLVMSLGSEVVYRVFDLALKVTFLVLFFSQSARQ